MFYREHWSRRLFVIANGIALALLAVACLFPLVHVLAISFSAGPAVSAGKVILWPVDFTTSAYDFALSRPAFRSAFVVSVQRVILGTVVNMVLTVLVAYPLSKENDVFPMRTVYTWFFIVTMLVSGGLIPLYMVVRWTGLLDSIWALVLPVAVPVFNVVLLMNFFRGLPKELEEAAFVDGASHWEVLFRIYLPLSMPAIATLTLFSFVMHWNSWFDGLIFMNSPDNYPLQSYLQTLVIGQDLSQFSMDPKLLQLVSNDTFKAAQIFIGALPILVLYPFLQRYFVKGIVLGSVKG
ncbi:MAG TPA: carbohydrate ABC transporter permease [Thermomicrobiales bacterium]|nr:carbohydrate ABC transporter permease [Thermomicrobiales bacterium]